MKCVKCGMGMAQGVTLHRTGPKGQDPKWHCEPCLPKGTEVDPAVAGIVAAIESSNQERKH